jgi:hypothetical protein
MLAHRQKAFLDFVGRIPMERYALGLVVNLK